MMKWIKLSGKCLLAAFLLLFALLCLFEIVFVAGIWYKSTFEGID